MNLCSLQFARSWIFISSKVLRLKATDMLKVLLHWLSHITLAVYRPPYSQRNRFIIELCGEAWTRFAETLKMLYAIHEAGLPITITNPESVRKRLLAQDNVGVIPSYDSYHRANQYFPAKQDVFEVLHYKDLGRYKRRITPFITWEPLPILRPKGCVDYSYYLTNLMIFVRQR